MTSGPTFIEAFAGASGLGLGLMRAGWRGILAIEKDPFAFATISANFPPDSGPMSFSWPTTVERRPWDVRDLLVTRRSQLRALAGRIDLVAGGPPCQGFSNAGRRRADDPRNLLFSSYLDLVHLLKPRFVLVENVVGIRSRFHAHPRGPIENFAAALEEALTSEFYVAKDVLIAHEFGVPQTRPRFFLIGAHKDHGSQREVNDFFDSLRTASDSFLAERGLPQRPTAADALSDLEEVNTTRIPSPETRGFDAIAHRSPLTPYQRHMHAGCTGPLADTRLARHRHHIRSRFAALIAAARQNSKHLTTISADTREALGLRKNTVRVLHSNRPAPTITSLPDDLIHYSEPRTLTVRETARLQSFPDTFVFKGNYTTGSHHRRNQVPRFTQVANAVPPLLAEQLGLALRRLQPLGRTSEVLFDAATDDFHVPSVFPERLPELSHPGLGTEFPRRPARRVG